MNEDKQAKLSASLRDNLKKRKAFVRKIKTLDDEKTKDVGLRQRAIGVSERHIDVKNKR